MEIVSVYIGLTFTAMLCGWASHAAWQAGYRAAAIGALLAVVIAGALFLYLGSIATGTFLAGLGEILIGLALLVGPGPGILLGIVTAIWHRVGLALSLLYALGLAALAAGVR